MTWVYEFIAHIGYINMYITVYFILRTGLPVHGLRSSPICWVVLIPELLINQPYPSVISSCVPRFWWLKSLYEISMKWWTVVNQPGCWTVLKCCKHLREDLATPGPKLPSQPWELAWKTSEPGSWKRIVWVEPAIKSGIPCSISRS